jgi:hypothetical protein
VIPLTKLRVLFIGRVLLTRVLLGSVHGTIAGDCRNLYLGSFVCTITVSDSSYDSTACSARSVPVNGTAAFAADLSDILEHVFGNVRRPRTGTVGLCQLNLFFTTINLINVQRLLIVHCSAGGSKMPGPTQTIGDGVHDDAAAIK